jgi:hypothetical protein
MGFAISDELRVMIAPRATYRRLCEEPRRPGMRALLRRPATMAVIIGGTITLTTAGALPPGLFVSSVLCWTVVPLAQLLVAAALIAVAGRGRAVPFAGAIDLFFVGHAPWSAWLLALGAVATANLPIGLFGLPRVPLVFATALVPLVWTAIILFAFCRTVLAATRWAAVGWTLGYQLAIYAVAYLYVGLVTRELPLFEAVGR